MSPDVWDMFYDLRRHLTKAGYDVRETDGSGPEEGFYYTWASPDGAGDVEVGHGTHADAIGAWIDAMDDYFSRTRLPSPID